MRKIAPEEKQLLRKSYVKRIMNVVRTKGFLSLTISDMAKLMNISRASLYNYFSSKEEILLEVIEYYLAYIHEADQMIADESLSYQIRLQKVYEQTILSALYASDIFMSDLKIGCPALYSRKMEARKERLATVHSFYSQGMADGIFHELNPTILIIQDEAALKVMTDSSFLLKEGLSLKHVLYDHYQAKTVQVLKPEAIDGEVDEQIHEVIERILQKLASTF
ncbi:TetR/AcrR family transcriptional regulator [Peribacillus sp. NPDC046944]|uniref:TetR/AcrR family transcriptional regulator n=1 Tax=unclassified Peribacillus TaxID=2675266 RepID=UPI003CFFE5AF